VPSLVRPVQTEIIEGAAVRLVTPGRWPGRGLVTNCAPLVTDLAGAGGSTVTIGWIGDACSWTSAPRCLQTLIAEPGSRAAPQAAAQASASRECERVRMPAQRTL